MQTTTVPKARLFQPLIDYACNIKKNPQDALNFVDDMKALNIEITPEILTAILIASRQSNSCSDIKVASRIDDLISTYATQSIGVSLNYARKLVSAYMNLSPKAVIEQGTLVAHQDQIKGEILSIDGDYDKTFDHKSVAYIKAIVNSHVDSSTNIKFDTIAAKRVRYQSMISSNPIDTLTDNGKREYIFFF